MEFMMDCFRRETIPAVITSGNNLFQRAAGAMRPGVAPSDSTQTG